MAKKTTAKAPKKSTPKKKAAGGLIKKMSSKKTNTKKMNAPVVQHKSAAPPPDQHSLGHVRHTLYDGTVHAVIHKRAGAPKRRKITPKRAMLPEIKKTLPNKRASSKRVTPKRAATGAPTEAPPEIKKTPSVQLPTDFKTGGAIVGGTDPCTCGDSPEEHGRDPRYPGSTRCNVTECGCIAYEADPEAGQEDPEPREVDPGSGPGAGTADPGLSEEDSGACEDDPRY